MGRIYWLNIKNHDGNADVKNKIGVTKGAEAVRGELRSLKSNILNEYKALNSFSPRSIPDANARTLFFDDYLFDNGNQIVRDIEKDSKEMMQKKARDQWLGFLSMIALSEVYDLNLWSKKIQPDSLDKLGKALYDGDRNSKTQYVIGILKDGLWYPVGTTDEKNIFIPGYWDEELSYDFPWIKGNDFCSPADNLTRGEKMILYIWLNKVSTAFKQDLSFVRLFNELKDSIKLQQNDYSLILNKDAHELQQCGAINNNIEPDHCFLKRVSLNALNVTDYMPNQYNDIIFNMDEEDTIIRNKDFRLVYSFLDNELLSKMVKKGKYEDFTEKFLDKSGYNIIIVDREIDEYIEDYIDIENIYYFTLEKAHESHKLSSGLKCGNKYFILPYREDMKDTDINKCEQFLRVVRAEEEDNAVYLNFYMKNIAQPIEIKYDSKQIKCLDVGQDGVHINPIPTTYIWPNVKGSSQYYFNSVHIETNNGLVFLPPNYNAAKIKKENNVHVIGSYPKYLDVYIVGEMDKKYIGIIPIDKLEKGNNGYKGIYSVDLGTSSTNIGYIDAKPVINNFESQISMIIYDDYRKKIDLEKINEIFYSNYEIIAPFPTIYYTGKNDEIKSGIFEKGHAYFINPNSSISFPIDKTFEVDIKFGKQSDSRYLYMSSLLNMILVDAANKGLSDVELYISYSLSMSEYGEFIDKVDSTIKELNTYNYYNVKFEKPKFISESFAAFKYAKTFYQINELIVVDIGGGTIDISVHSAQGAEEDKPCKLASFRRGSREFFVKSFENDLVFLVELLKKCSEHIEPIYTQNSKLKEISKENQFSEFFEILMSLNYEESEHIYNLGNKMIKEFEKCDVKR